MNQENCQGLGVIYINLTFLESVKLPCEACEDRRFKDEVLAYKLTGKSISEVLEMTAGRRLVLLQSDIFHRIGT